MAKKAGRVASSTAAWTAKTASRVWLTSINLATITWALRGGGGTTRRRAGGLDASFWPFTAAKGHLFNPLCSDLSVKRAAEISQEPKTCCKNIHSCQKMIWKKPVAVFSSPYLGRLWRNKCKRKPKLHDFFGRSLSLFNVFLKERDHLLLIHV